MKHPRAKMSTYMNSLKIKVFYSSLKTQYLEQQARMFPSLNQGTDSNLTNTEEERMDGADQLIIPQDPSEIRDKEITTLNKKVDDTIAENETLKNTLEAVQRNLQISQKKLEFTKKATEKKLIDSITNPEGYRADNILIGVYSATLDEDEIDFEAETEHTKEPRSRKDVFDSMKKQLDLENVEQKERFKEVSNLILEKVKHTKHSRLRSRSISSQGSIKRARSQELNDSDRSTSRPRTSGIPVKS